MAAPGRGCLLLSVIACAWLVGCGTSPRPRRPPVTSLGTTTTVATTSTTSVIRYTVAAGDTLGAIAQRFRVTVGAIVSASHLTNPNQLAPGQVLVIPRAQPVRLVITPARGPVGRVFAFDLTGAQPGEVVMFEITRPDGTKFDGPPHDAQPDGSVTTSYLTAQGDQPGVYKVVVSGAQGTTAQTSFEVVSAPTTTSAQPG